MSVARQARSLTQDALADAADLDPTYIRSDIDAQRAAVAPTFAMTGVTGLTVSQSVCVPDKQAASVPQGTL